MGWAAMSQSTTDPWGCFVPEMLRLHIAANFCNYVWASRLRNASFVPGKEDMASCLSKASFVACCWLSLSFVLESCFDLGCRLLLSIFDCLAWEKLRFKVSETCSTSLPTEWELQEHDPQGCYTAFVRLVMWMIENDLLEGACEIICRTARK